MAFDEAQFRQLLAHVNERWRSKNCLICGANNWAFNGPISLSINPSFATVALGGPHLPTAAAVCQTCGNTVLINLIVAGMVKTGG